MTSTSDDPRAAELDADGLRRHAERCQRTPRAVVRVVERCQEQLLDSEPLLATRYGNPTGLPQHPSQVRGAVDAVAATVGFARARARCIQRDALRLQGARDVAVG